MSNIGLSGLVCLWLNMFSIYKGLSENGHFTIVFAYNSLGWILLHIFELFCIMWWITLTFTCTCTCTSTLKSALVNQINLHTNLRNGCIFMLGSSLFLLLNGKLQIFIETSSCFRCFQCLLKKVIKWTLYENA